MTQENVKTPMSVAESKVQPKTGPAPDQKEKAPKEPKEPKPKVLSAKEKKFKAKEFLKKIFDKDEKPKFSSEYIGLEFNEKGGFYSIIVNVQVSTPSQDGVELAINRDVKLPLSLTDDVKIKG